MGMKLTRDIAPRPERLKDVPYTRLRGDDLLNICRFHAAWDVIERLLDDEWFVNRCKTLPGRYRDLCMIRSKMDIMMQDILHTVPREKAKGVIQALDRMRFSVSMGKVASRDRYEDEQIVDLKWLNALIAAAHENKCLLCDDNCNCCELGKALDNLLPQDRNGGSWSMMDIEVGDE